MVLVSDNGKAENPVFYLSQTLGDAKTRYTKIEKYILSLIHCVNKNRYYFYDNPIVVVTIVPILSILARGDNLGMLGKWIVEINQFHIKFHWQTEIKSGVLANILVEFPVIDLVNSELEYGPERVDLPGLMKM